MKQSFARQHSRNRNQTPSVIYLPPPKPPVTAKRAETAPEAARPAMTPATPGTDPAPRRSEPNPPRSQHLSRQARRKALRDEAKALRRTGQLPSATDDAAVQASTGLTRTDIGGTAPAVAAPVESQPDAPLPRDRALTTARPGGLTLFVRRLGVLFGFRRAVPADNRALAGQLRSLRAELAALQKSVDRIIDGVAV